MHATLERQIAESRREDGTLDVDGLLRRVSASYSVQEDRLRQLERGLAEARCSAGTDEAVANLIAAWHDGVVLCDPSGRVVSLNAAAEIIFGASSLAVEGMQLFELMEIGSTVDHLITGEIRRGDGSRVPIEITMGSVPVGEQEMTVVSVRNVSERKRVERELSQSRALLGSIIDNIPHGIITKNAREDMTIVLCNRSASELFGFARDEALGLRAADLMPPNVADETAADEAKVCAERQPMLKTVRRRSRAGSELTIEKQLIPLADEEGTVTHVLEIFENVTTVREQERKLREAKEQAEAANQAKSAFLATMSHEIRTPMNGVLGMTALLLDSALDDKQRRFAKLIKVSAENLLVIINDILDMSKIEAGRLSIDDGEYDLAQVCQGAVDVVRPRADARSLGLTLRIDGSLARPRRGDGDRLRQVLVNLAGNAVKFTDKGSITLSVSEGNGAQTLRFAVTDTGIGIPVEDQAKLFREFVQVDSSATRKFGGTGLGLAICKKLVELMGGTIGVESQPGVGSTFWFELPAPLGTSRVRTVTRPSALPGETPAAKRLRVLVAEDNPINQEVVRGYLDQLGCEVSLVGNGKEALAQVAAQPYDLVLMDMQMPEMDGLAATRAIRGLGGEPSQIPIVMLTANAMHGDRERCLDAGADDHLAKPIDRARLRELVDQTEPRPTHRLVVRPPTLAPPAAPDLDVGQLRELLEALGPKGFAGLVAKAEVSFETNLAKVAEALQRDDHEAMAKLAHGFVGSAGSLGLVAASRSARTLETSCAEGAELEVAVNALTAALRRGLLALREHVGTKAA